MNCSPNAIQFSMATGMNSSDDLPLNGMLEDSASSSQLPNSDSNANLSNGNQNKGAIPKTKITKSTSKKSTKLNNNVDEVVTSKGPTVSEDVLQMHTDMLRLNGFSDQLSRISSSYLDEYKSTLYESDMCENCCGVSKASYNDIFTDESSQRESSKLLSYQPGTSTGKSDTNFQFVADSDSSDNELLSISDDGCIYTYKGDQAADLPSSFFTLDIPPSRSPEIHPPRQENASPEMDFLEMDFDPGPSGDADSDSQSNADLENAENLPQDPLHHVAENIIDQKKPRIDELSFSRLKSPLTEASSSTSSCRAIDLHLPQPSTSTESYYTPASPSTSIKQDSPMSSITERFRKMRMPWSCSMNERTITRFGNRISKRHLTSTGELTSPSERIATADDFAYFGSEKATGDSLPREKVLIWTEEEAFRKQVTQIGASACGATAVINVLKALRLPLPPFETIKDAVKTRLRANSSPLAEYLLSRSVAGSTHEDLIEGLLKATDGQVYARFFHMYPERVVNLHSWLQFWISHGAVPIATLNLQKCIGPIPDAWHHQMIFGVGPKGIYLTNPLECVDPGQLWPQLSSESQLLIRKEDIFSRWNIQTDLEQLIDIKDEKWFKMNVVGQVANLIRESTREKRLGFASTSHIKIPAAYSSGITLVMKVDDPLCPLLRFCSELPVLPQNDGATGCSDFY